MGFANIEPLIVIALLALGLLLNVKARRDLLLAPPMVLAWCFCIG